MNEIVLENFRFEKFHGLGNDYIIINDIQLNIPEDKKKDLAKKLCEIHISIGADGLLFVCNSDRADIKMRIFNKDGTEAEMCGNGIRCFAKYVYEHSIVKKRDIEIETLKGVMVAKLKGFNEDDQVNSVQIDMGPPILDCDEIPVIPGNNESECVNDTLVVLDKIFNFTAVSMGPPNAVIFINGEITNNDLNKYGAAIESNERFPNRTNVEFVRVISPTEANLRVFERGVGITNSCGTGTCAAVVAGTILGKFKKSNPIIVHNDGGDLIITYNGKTVLMEGPVERVFTGVIEKIEI